ncbi:CoA transferase, partial [Georgenia thermotolerans]
MTTQDTQGPAAPTPWPELSSAPVLRPGDDAAADGVTVTGPRRIWAGPLDVEALAVGSVREAARAAAALADRRGAPRWVSLDSRHVAAAFDDFRHLRVAGRAPEAWAPLSTFYPAADGWVRVHANYPHHRRALLTALGLPPDDDGARAAVAEAVAALPAHTVETRVRAAGGVAAALRTPAQWRAHEQGRLVADLPLVDLARTDAPGRAPAPTDGPPLAGVRVLDLTRVLAGPTATRLLGALGADVLRIDPPDNPELLDQHLDTGFAKRSAVADLTDPVTRHRVDELLAGADVLVTGYRPGALAGLGLDAEAVLARRPGLVVAELSAWGPTGPWGHERGFDSIVQVATGIASVYGTGEGHPGEQRPGREGPAWRPGALPVQALDFATGYLVGAAVMRMLAGRADHGGGVARVALARVAAELLGLGAPPGEGPAGPPAGA